LRNTNNAIPDTFDIKKRGLLSESTREKMKIYWYNFRSNKFSLVGLSIVAACIFFAIFAPYIVPHPKDIYGFVDFSNAKLPPCSLYWFGTDVCGRDIFSRVIYSFRGAILMSIVVLGISVPFGVGMGLIAGYYHGTWVDTLIMRITDVFLAIPALILALAVASILKPNLTSTMISLTVYWWTWYSRMAYGSASSISKEYFVINAEVIGASKVHILIKEILPSMLSPIFTKMALDVCWVILVSASLNFVGLGEQPPIPAFGTMISEGSKYMPEIWWITLFPALGIAFIILGFNLLGDGIRDALERGE